MNWNLVALGIWTVNIATAVAYGRPWWWLITAVVSWVFFAHRATWSKSIL